MGNTSYKLLLICLFTVIAGCSNKSAREPQSTPLSATECDSIPNEFNQEINKIPSLDLQFQQQDTFSKVHTGYLLSIHTACTSKMSPEARTSYCKRAKNQSHNSKYDLLSLKESLSEEQYLNTSRLIQRAEKIITDFCD